MAVLVDTNVLVRFAVTGDSKHPIARRAIDTLRRRGAIHTASQNLIELWNVLTRPLERNGFSKSPDEAAELLDLVEALFPRLDDHPDTYRHWRELVLRHGVSGVQVHDARLVASMLCHGLSEILTFNGRDFSRYAARGIRVIDPGEV
ncbi:MAG: type II toxin-antitoxin system VapC family toxin [Holophagales bacterium]|nr:type II toxin-antitoxin system VapC family toxin [Holophagales bacterium]